jgi:hypothetical protein
MSRSGLKQKLPCSVEPILDEDWRSALAIFFDSTLELSQDTSFSRTKKGEATNKARDHQKNPENQVVLTRHRPNYRSRDDRSSRQRIARARNIHCAGHPGRLSFRRHHGTPRNRQATRCAHNDRISHD